jgi:foldase protein PrsA
VVWGSRQIAAAAASALAALSIGACGGGSNPKEVVVRVGDQAITRATLAHWVGVLRGGPTAPDATSAQTQAMRREALKLLIASQWLIGEAAKHGLSISTPEIHRQIDRIENAGFPGGNAELAEFLKSTGQSVADVELRARAQVAAAKLRQQAIAGVPSVTAAQIATFYAQHKRQFLIPERREARFRNKKKKAEAEKLKREVEAGKSLTSPAQRKVGELFTTARVPPGDVYEKAIDSAKPHVVAGPFKLHADYWLYEVVRVIPARQQSLATVSGKVRGKLLAERRRDAVQALVAGLKATWTAKTDCKSGYVVQKCRQYSAHETAEDPLTVP